MSKDIQKQAEEFAYEWMRKNKIWHLEQEKLMPIIEDYTIDHVLGRPMPVNPVFEIYDTVTGKKMNDAMLRDMALENKDDEFARVSHFWMDLEGFALGADGSLYVLDEMGGWQYAPERFEVRMPDEQS